MTSQTAKHAIHASAILLLCGLSTLPCRAQTGPVYSLNTIGYQKITAPSTNYRLSAVPFATPPATVDRVIGGQLTAGAGPETADNLLLFDTAAQRYRLLYLVNGTGDTNLDNHWIDTSVEPNGVATCTVPPNLGFWIRNRQVVDQTVIVVGDIVNDPTVTTPIVPGYQLLSYPYSTSIKINDTTLTNGAHAGLGMGSADNIITWDPGTRSYRYYYLLGDVGDTNLNYKWIDTGMHPNDVATSALKRGQAFWYNHRGSGFNWVESRPYSLP